MTKLNIIGLDQSENTLEIEPAENGTYKNIGSQGGTEMMHDALMKKLPSHLTEQFNIICSRVRKVDSSKRNLLWLHDTWDDPESQHLKEKSKRDRFEKLIFVSNYQLCTYNLGLGVPYQNATVLQNAIEPIEQHQKPNDKINIIYHTTPHRGLELLIPVCDFLSKQGIDFHLDVYSSFAAYGWPARDEPYLELFEKIKNHPSMTYHGFQPNTVIREALKKAHIYAYPSIWPETSAISVIEAMSAGCNVVCPNFAALPETCANFGVMYNWSENNNEHANRFSGVLATVIKIYWVPFNQERLKFQKAYTDSFYNWDMRARQWQDFLESLSVKK
jgi:glycosyltransferase involved in cell wall biosynthesis